MKQIIMIAILSLCIYFPGSGQMKILGTVTFYYNPYQGNRADVGADIFVVDSALSNINFKAIDSFITGEKRYSNLNSYLALYQTTKSSLKGSFLSRKKKEEMLANADVPERVWKDAEAYTVDTEEGFRRLDSAAAKYALIVSVRNNYNAKADGVGNYSVNIRKPGTYYVIVRSANRQGPGMTFMLGKLYMEKVILEVGDERNVSTNISL